MKGDKEPKGMTNKDSNRGPSYSPAAPATVNVKPNQDSRRPKPVFFWNNADVMKWLKRHCEEYYGLYGQLFLEHEITGRSMVRMTEVTLTRMGINDAQHRDDLCRIILKLKLKSDILEMKDLEKKSEYSVASSMTMGLS